MRSSPHLTLGNGGSLALLWRASLWASGGCFLSTHCFVQEVISFGVAFNSFFIRTSSTKVSEPSWGRPQPPSHFQDSRFPAFIFPILCLCRQPCFGGLFRAGCLNVSPASLLWASCKCFFPTCCIGARRSPTIT